MTRELLFERKGFRIYGIVVGPMDNNVYLIVDEATNKSLIVDAADDPEAILAFAEGTDVIGVFTTHGHWDHHQAVPEVPEALGVGWWLHEADIEIAEKQPDKLIEPGSIAIGKTKGTVLHTPGHTPGSVSLALDGVVLTGDTLFPGGPGATRFAHSSFDTIIDSISSSLFTMIAATVVLPGHGAGTTMGTEQPQLDEWIKRGW